LDVLVGADVLAGVDVFVEDGVLAGDAGVFEPPFNIESTGLNVFTVF
jgi:hypothetical protein